MIEPDCSEIPELRKCCALLMSFAAKNALAIRRAAAAILGILR
jgi:hypothetical protein